MAKYTTELRTICEYYAGINPDNDLEYRNWKTGELYKGYTIPADPESWGLTGYSNINQILEGARAQIFGDFPIYKESHRAELEDKILKHYYTREIGSETVGLFKLRLSSRMNEIMPYYNELYKTLDMEYDPLKDFERTTTSKTTGTTNSTSRVTGNGTSSNNSTTTDDIDSTSSNTSSGTSANTQKYSDTPQGTISNLANDTYLTNATMNNGNTSGTDSGTATQDRTTTTTASGTTGNTTDSTASGTTGGTLTETVTGKVSGKSYQELIKEYRENIINIDALIIAELSDLFLALW